MIYKDQKEIYSSWPSFNIFYDLLGFLKSITMTAKQKQAYKMVIMGACHQMDNVLAVASQVFEKHCDKSNCSFE